jgi:hypothetical protein
MDWEDVATFVQKNVEPLPASPPFGERYRVAATLIDGTRLPCVVVESASKWVDLAVRRFEQSKNSSDVYMGYRAIVSRFVAKGSRIDIQDLRELAVSPFAISLAHLHEIRGETSMSWTQFRALMTDGEEFKFGTPFRTEFFEMPKGYSATEIAKIIPSARGEPRYEGFYRDRPFFTCYVEGL